VLGVGVAVFGVAVFVLPVDCVAKPAAGECLWVFVAVVRYVAAAAFGGQWSGAGSADKQHNCCVENGRELHVELMLLGSMWV